MMPRSITNEQAINHRVEATHQLSGHSVDMKPLLAIIEDIFQCLCAAPSVPAGFVQKSAQELKSSSKDTGDFDDFSIFYQTVLSRDINKVSCQISSMYISGEADADTTTLKILETLSMYDWDGKVLVAIAVLALTFHDSCLIAQIYPTNTSLAKSISVLKPYPKRFDKLKMKMKEEIKVNIKAMLDVAKRVLEFKELPSEYITNEKTELNPFIHTTIYWTIQSILACTTLLTGGLDGWEERQEERFTESELQHFTIVADTVKERLDCLTNQLNRCRKIIDEKRHIETYQALIKLMETPHIDNMKVLRALIYAKDDNHQPLVEGFTNRMVSLNVLRRKNVLLLISDLDVSHDELFILEQMYQESRQHSTRDESQYEVVWLPVVDRITPLTEEKEQLEQQFESIRMTTPWYSIRHPSMVDRAVIRNIKENWHFEKKPILVVLDVQGKVVNTNAFHMTWIWGSLAFPFTNDKEEALWRKEHWRLELLAGSVDPSIPLWILEKNFVCLYGGEDIEWIQNFTETAQKVAEAAAIQLKLVYVGKSNPQEKVRRNMETIAAKNLSHTLQEIPLIWFFWERLERMWHSKMKLGKSAETDPITKEIMTMLSFDESDQGWAVIFRGDDMVKAKGEAMLKCFGDYDLWKSKVNQVGRFIPAIKDHLQTLYTPHHCNRLILPGTTGTMPKRVACADCGQPMEQFIMFRCCND